MQSLDGRLVLITGASSGIGRAAAVAFVAAGARVVGLARQEDRLRELERELGGAPRFVPIKADVADAQGMEAMALRVRQEIGLPDVLVANAGIGLDARFTEMTDEALRAVLEVNVFGVVRTIRPFLPAMLERGSGRVLIISSIVGKRGVPSYAGYCASKFALQGMADALHSELWGSGVSAGVVCPASTVTGFADRALRKGPAQRRVRPVRHSAESVAKAIVAMARSRRREHVLSLEGKLMVFGGIVAPRLVDWIMHRALVAKRT
jgi:short-subunit dehydrogenase